MTVLSVPYHTKPLPAAALKDVQDEAPVQEVFSSIQGEGPYVGRRQVFVRFAHCHLKCAYCDTPMQSATGQCFVETIPSQGYQETLENPVSVDCLAHAILSLVAQTSHHSVSFTGGEPLLYHRFLAQLLPQIQPHVKTYLETSGTQANFLKPLLPHIDIVAMDIKLPSATQEAPQWEHHAAFYQATKTQTAGPEVFIKLVFNEWTSTEELSNVLSIVTERNTPIILQPETRLNPTAQESSIRVTPSQIALLEGYLARHFSDVRVIPQTHKMLQVL